MESILFVRKHEVFPLWIVATKAGKSLNVFELDPHSLPERRPAQ